MEINIVSHTMMKMYFILLFPLTLISHHNTEQKFTIISERRAKILTDSIPEICSIITAREIDSLNPFGVPLSNSFPDPNNYDVYNGCQYQFFTPSIKPQMTVRLLKMNSRSEAADAYRNSINAHTGDWYGIPERIYQIADSAYFNHEGEDSAKCDECGLVVLQGLYTVYVSFKGAYDEAPRERKKMVALQILQMMYDRIPGLGPPRIRS